LSSDEIKKPHLDMCVGSLCSDFIIANSTFSWWMSFLGRHSDKKILMPFPWFGPALQHLDTSGYYPPGTNIISREMVKV